MQRDGLIILRFFYLKSVGPPSYYLGNNHNYDLVNKIWVTCCFTHIKEYICRVETHPIVGGTYFPHKTPLPPEVHPKLDTSPLLANKGVKVYQMLIGMIQCACVVGCLEILFGVLSMSHF